MPNPTGPHTIDTKAKFPNARPGFFINVTYTVYDLYAPPPPDPISPPMAASPVQRAQVETPSATPVIVGCVFGANAFSVVVGVVVLVGVAVAVLLLVRRRRGQPAKNPAALYPNELSAFFDPNGHETWEVQDQCHHRKLDLTSQARQLASLLP